MYQFINGFTCSSAEDGGTVIIQLRQKLPYISGDGDIQGIKAEQIASIIMEMDVALELGKALCAAKDGFEPEDDPMEEEDKGPRS